MSLSLVIARVQTLWEAKGAKWCDKDYVTAFISIHNEDVELLFDALGLSYGEDDIILPAVPANTCNLSAYQANGQPLASMMSPYSLEWRCPVEANCATPPTEDQQWHNIERLDKVIDRDPNADDQIPGIRSYAWKGGIIQITPSSIAVDIRVGCEMLPDIFQSDSDNYIKGTTNILAYGVAEMIAEARGAGASKHVAFFQKKKLDVMDSVESIFVQQEQLTPRRLRGRRSRVPGPNWAIPRE